MIAYSPGTPPPPKEAIGCSAARDIAGGCQMPQNQKH